MKFIDEVSVLIMRSIDRHAATSCRRCVCIEWAGMQKNVNQQKFTDILSNYVAYLKFIEERI